MATRIGGVQPHFENGSWFMRSPTIDATSISGAMSRPLAQVRKHMTENLHARPVWVQFGASHGTLLTKRRGCSRAELVVDIFFFVG